MAAGGQIPKHKGSLPLAEMAPVRHIYQKWELGIKGLEHMASFPLPLPLWSPGNKRKLPIKDYFTESRFIRMATDIFNIFIS